MKKFLFTTLLLVSCTALTQAQEISENAIGLRLGGGDGIGAEISYQRAVGSNNNRLEFDLGWRDDKYYDLFKAVGLYHWVWNIEGGFNWYAGAGAGLAGVSYKDDDDDFDGDGSTHLFLAGNVGIEYNFDIPLLLSLDIRPELFVGDGFDDNFTPDIALGVRYQF